MRTSRVVVHRGADGLRAGLGSGAAHAQAPDLILVNGKVVTVDAQSSLQEALAIRDGRILALGRARRSDGSRVPPHVSSISAGAR
jgi:urease alpha subunit